MMKKYSLIKTLIYSAICLFAAILIFNLAENMGKLTNNNVSSGFSLFQIIIDEILFDSLKRLFIIMISFSLSYFLIPAETTFRKLIFPGFIYILVLVGVFSLPYILEEYNKSLFLSKSPLMIIGMFLGGTIKLILHNRNSFVDSIENNKKLFESKTAFLMLQAQLNPHFLFNSLNNIDILVEENPKTASEYLKKLSDILRYVLYETKEDETDLVKEIDQIISYIELQKIRTDNPHYVNFTIKGELKDQKIAPMIFIPFIENAFKHCKNKSIENAIQIEFEMDEHEIKMLCKNFYEENQLEIIKNEGLGIETIKQRLNLLYPKNHELKIDKSENWFHVSLNITLNI